MMDMDGREKAVLWGQPDACAQPITPSEFSPESR